MTAAATGETAPVEIAPVETGETEAEAPLLERPAGPWEPVIDDWERLDELIDQLSVQRQPIALDTERASGFRYYGHAYLIQLKTVDGGAKLIDPIALADRPPADLSRLGAVINDREWILHAASQDLPCLAELGLSPVRLFDTELAARLVGRPRVGLGPLAEDLLGLRLRKDHAAADWSTRPLPEDWLVYAALDVELLHQLRQLLQDELAAQDKTEWAEQEFQHWLEWSKEPSSPPPDPWRRTAGLHLVRSRRGLAVVRQLWTDRDQLARQLDLAPSRLLNDRGITDLAAQVSDSGTVDAATLVAGSDWFRHRQAARHRPVWLTAVRRAAQSTEADWPPFKRSDDGPPPPRQWKQTNPAAARRWAQVRPAVDQRAEQLGLPPENLIKPESLRRLAWSPRGRGADAVAAQLGDLGARPWQCEQVAPVVATAWAAAGRDSKGGAGSN
ncbi:MAG: ribonuclease D [Propionibacteriaceae bacterium]|nr:ribonuclease D [Propionibacteriaceae bacterium]